MRITQATGEWMKLKSFAKVLIGYDSRFGSKYYAELSAALLAEMDLQELITDEFVSSTMVSYGVVNNSVHIAIIIKV